MLYHLSNLVSLNWGPLRLFRSHALLLAGGTMLAALTVLLLLPRLWRYLPHDQGKALVQGGMQSKGKPTGAGFWISLLVLPVILLVMPLNVPDLGVILCLYAAMVFGYLDDRSVTPWGQLKKGLLDAVVSFGVALFIYIGYAHGTGEAAYAKIWLPFVKGMWQIPWYIYLPGDTFLLWFTMKATNCSDGVDGLAGSLTLITLVSLAVLLYLVIGYMPVAHYMLIPVGGTAARLAARWAILLMTVAGGIAGYLWWNSEPSKVLMGDAGSRFLGLLVGAGVLVSGNPFLVIAFAPVVLVNGGAGLGKLVLLRFMRKLGLDVRPPSVLPPELVERQNPFVRLLHGIRFPLHDHCKRSLKWSNAQVLMRFVLLQAFLTPLLFVLLVKIR